MSIVVDFFRARLLYRVAAETSSEALEADALHFGSDMWSSLAVLIGLGAVALGYPWADSAAAVVVAVFICIAGWRLGRRTIGTLTDTAPAGAADKVRDASRRASPASSRSSACGCGRRATSCSSISSWRSAARCRSIASPPSRSKSTPAVRAAFPNAETTVNTEPRALDDETVLERVMVIARNRALAVHHVTVHAIGGRLSVSLDLEVDGSLRSRARTRSPTGSKQAVRDELGPEVEVETHIEPLQMDGIAGRDAPGERVAACEPRWRRSPPRPALVRDVHDVRVRETADGEIVNFHCYVDPGADGRRGA